MSLSLERRRFAGPELYEVLREVGTTHGAWLAMRDPGLAQAVATALAHAEGRFVGVDPPHARIFAAITRDDVEEMRRIIDKEDCISSEQWKRIDALLRHLLHERMIDTP